MAQSGWDERDVTYVTKKRMPKSGQLHTEKVGFDTKNSPHGHIRRLVASRHEQRSSTHGLVSKRVTGKLVMT